MSGLYSNDIKIVDLADEILLMILNKLDQIDVLHSVVHVNRRFQELALDPLYIRDLHLSDMSNLKSLFDSTLPFDRESISRLSEEILPQIHHLVQKLTIEQCLAKHVLGMNYPQLYSLSLMHFEEEILYQYLTGNIFDFIRFSRET